jgi:hypothetical protein
VARDTSGFEAIPATRWPAPVEVVSAVSAEDSHDEDDDTADRQATDALIVRR